jgi:hypothetical protein
MEKEEFLEEDDMKISMFELDSDEADSFGAKSDEDDEDEQEEIKENEDTEEVEETEKTNDDEDESEDDSDEQEETETDTSELNETEKILATLIEEGSLFLPEDYEYEPTTEGLKKAFEDSEAFRNESAFREAINFLISKEGMDFVKIRQLQTEIESIDVDNDELSDNAKVELIKKFYSDKGFEDEDLEEKIEEIIDEEKIDKEFKIAAKYLKRQKEKELEVEANRPVEKVQEQKNTVEQTKRYIKQTLNEVSSIDGYTISPKNKDKIFDAIYKPVRDQEGNITTEFSYRLGLVLSNPEKLLVLADILVNMDDKGYNFKNLEEKLETKVTKTFKKNIKELSKSDSKTKVTGKNFQTKKEFDLSKASLFTFK